MTSFQQTTKNEYCVETEQNRKQFKWNIVQEIRKYKKINYDT